MSSAPVDSLAGVLTPGGSSASLAGRHRLRPTGMVGARRRFAELPLDRLIRLGGGIAGSDRAARGYVACQRIGAGSGPPEGRAPGEGVAALPGSLGLSVLCRPLHRQGPQNIFALRVRSA